MPIKVCIFTSVHPAFDTRIFHKQAMTLVKAGYDVILLAQHDRDEVADRVKIIALHKPGNRIWRVLGTWRMLCLTLKQKAAIYHFHDAELLPVGLLLKVLTMSPVVYDVHEDVPKQILTKEYLPPFVRQSVSKLAAFLERVALYSFDAVIAAGEDITWHFPKSQKLAVIRNFPSIDILNETEFKSYVKSSGQPATMIYVGVISEGRGVMEMVEVANRLQNKVRLILVGSFADSYLEAKIKQKAGDNVEFTGQVPYENVPGLLRRADIGLVCFRPDPNNMAAAWRNNKLFEYMAAGLPVIASNLPLWKEIINNNRCGLTVDLLDPRDMSRAVEYLIDHPDAARAMGENGMRAIKEKYNWENEGKKLLALYESLIGQQER